MLARTLAACAALFFVCAPFAHAQTAQHPLDPLSWQEYWTVLEVLADAGHLDEGTELSRVHLRGPDKSGVWKWTPGSSITRSAFAVVGGGQQS